MSNLPITKKTRNTFVAIIIGMMVIIAAILMSGILNFNLVENLVMSWVLTTLYALIAFFLIDPTIKMTPVRVVERPVYQEVIKEVRIPVEKKVIEVVEKIVVKPIQIPIENRVVEVVEKIIIKPIQIPIENRVVEVVEKIIIKPIQIPIENRVVEVVEKEVIKEVPVERIVYQPIERKHKKLNIPKFEFIGSTQTKTYHKRNCKFSKMLKNKYKLHSNSLEFFKGKHYHACKTCLKKENQKNELHAKHQSKLQYKKQIKNIKDKIDNLKKENYKKHYKVCNEAQFKPHGYGQDFIKKEEYELCLA